MFTRSVLLGRDEAEAALVVSELATNAIRHTASGEPGGVFIVSVTVRADGVMIAVDDLGSATEPAIRDPVEELAASGRGLMLVATVAKEWGISRTATGRRVWAELSGHDAACGA